MSAPEDKIKDFVVGREGEIVGLTDFLNHLTTREKDFKDNITRSQMTSAAILAALDRINVSIDTQLLRLDASNPETLTQQLLDALVEIRRSIKVEEQTTVREFGFVYGSLNTANEISNTLNEKIESAKTSISNQKELLKRADDSDPSRRPVGTRPIPMKDIRKFDDIVNKDEKGE